MNLISRHKNIAIASFLLCISAAFPAQHLIGLEEAVAIAWNNNPTIKAADLGIEKEKTLKKIHPGIDKTSFQYQNGQLNANVIDYSFQVSQSFRFPVYKAYKSFQNATIKLSENNLLLSKSELAKQVRTTYSTIVLLQEKLILFQSLSDIYEEMKIIASKKYLAGETSVLEKTIATSKYEEAKVVRDQLINEISSTKKSLALLLNNGVDSVEVEKTNIQLPLVDSSDISNNPSLLYYQQYIEVKNKNVTLHQQQYLPDFNLGYFNQQIEGVQGMQGFIVGINIPIFYGNIKSNVQAAKIETKIAESELNGHQLTLQNQIQQKIANYNNHQLEVSYYESTGSNLEKQIIEFSTKAYHEGEIGYLEYLENVSQATMIKTKYLESLHALNMQAIEIIQLIGK